MNTKIFLSLLAAGSFCVVAPAQAQQPESKKTGGAEPATKQSAGKAGKQASTASSKSTDKSAKTGATASGKDQTVEVVLGSMGVNPTKMDVAAGGVVIDMTNNSDKPHKMVLSGGTMKKVEGQVSVGGTGKITADLTPGSYSLRCEMSGHMESGAKLTVK